MQQETGDAPPHEAGSGSSSDGSSVNGSSVGDDDSRHPKRARFGDAPAGAGAAASSAHGDAAAPAGANVVNDDGDDDDAASVHADNVDFDGGGSGGGGSSPASDRSDTATVDLSSHGAAHGGDGSPGGGSSSSSSSSSTSSGGAAAPIYSTYEHVVISALRAAHEQDARSATNRNETSIGELRAAAFAISNRLSHRLMTGVLGLLRNLGGSTVRVTRGDTLRERARVFFARHGPWLCRWEKRIIELKDPAGVLSPHRRRVRIWVRTHVDEAIAAHLERHGRVGVNVLLHPSDPEPAYNHHQDARFIARDTGPAVVGAPFKGSFCTGLVAAVTAAVHARHPDRAHEPAVVVPLAMSLDMAAVSSQQSGAMLFLQPHNYVGPFARSTNALIPVAVVGALDLEKALSQGIKAFEPGLLARANRGFLYIDEVNLLEDHLVDLLIDVAASGENLVEREGLSVRHPARFVLVGSGNPEEGELRPQLLDRFGLSLEVATRSSKAETFASAD
jgi:hypothetical protein